MWVTASSIEQWHTAALACVPIGEFPDGLGLSASARADKLPVAPNWDRL
jgi:hypothetical protein